MLTLGFPLSASYLSYLSLNDVFHIDLGCHLYLDLLCSKDDDPSELSVLPVGQVNSGLSVSLSACDIRDLHCFS